MSVPRLKLFLFPFSSVSVISLLNPIGPESNFGTFHLGTIEEYFARRVVAGSIAVPQGSWPLFPHLNVGSDILHKL